MLSTNLLTYLLTYLFARASAVTPSGKKVQLTLIGSPLRTFQYELRLILYVALKPPLSQMTAQKRKTAVFRVKLHLT